MSERILITGSAGLIGSALRRTLTRRGEEVAGIDVRALLRAERGDIRNAEDLLRVAANCRGIVHLAAVSRVVWGERDPELCRATNISGTRAIVEHALAAKPRPWILYASSREVYGQAARLPATEDTPFSPLNTYARSKVAAELLIGEAQAAGVTAAVVRLSNVYGGAGDHPDRVVPAFVRAALSGTPLKLEGRDHSFDFTHVDDVVRGLLTLIEQLDRRSAPPPIQLLTGRATTLGELAHHCATAAKRPVTWIDAPPRTYDVAHFYGDPARAEKLLGWRAQIPILEGITRLAADYRFSVATAREEGAR